jgi:hypothetical protein
MCYKMSAWSDSRDAASSKEYQVDLSGAIPQISLHDRRTLGRPQGDGLQESVNSERLTNGALTDWRRTKIHDLSLQSIRIHID